MSLICWKRKFVLAVVLTGPGGEVVEVEVVVNVVVLQLTVA